MYLLYLYLFDSCHLSSIFLVHLVYLILNYHIIISRGSNYFLSIFISIHFLLPFTSSILSSKLFVTCLSFYVYLPFTLSFYIFMSILPSFYLSIYLSIYLPIYLSIFAVSILPSSGLAL